MLKQLQAKCVKYSKPPNIAAGGGLLTAFGCGIHGIGKIGC